MKEFGAGVPTMIRFMKEHNGTEPELAGEDADPVHGRGRHVAQRGDPRGRPSSFSR
jgi:hypothetical protein